MTWQVFPAKSFTDYRKQWDHINCTGPNSPVLNSAFMAHSITEFGTGKEKLAIYGDIKTPLAMAVLQKTKLGVWDTFQPSQSPLGAWINESKLEYSVLLKELMSTLPGLVLKLGITQQDPNIFPRPAVNRSISTLDYIQTAKIKINGTFKEYWSSRGKNLRHNLKRQRNRLEKEGVRPSLKIIREPSSVAQAIADYGKLESAGWKASEGTAIAIDNAQGRFYVSLLEEFCSQQKGYIYQYYYNDALVATDLCIEQGGVLVILKTTYDESISTSSPAFLMRQDAFEQIFASSQIKSIEFYGKMMDWHTKWSDDSRTLYHINCKRL